SDHHEWKTNDDGSPKLPEANAVVHPRLPGTTYANGNLCGAGVAFKLAWGTGQAISGQAKVCDALKAFLVEAMALAALGTIADVVPLVGENRILAYYGLGGLKQTKITGLLALIESADLDGKNIDSYHVGFLLAPRLNAAGRMGHAALAAEMLTNASPERALEIAEYLEQQNRTRQATERAILEQAIAQIGTLNLIEQDQRAIVVGAAGWHPGVIGIVASRIVDRFHRPAVVVGLGDEIGQGSGRSIDGFHLSQALEKVSHTLVSHGGHEMAAGLKVLPSRFEEFREAFAAHANSALEPAALVPELKLDCCVPLSQMCEALISDLDRLGPFGRGNPRPVLRCENLSLTAPPRRVGKTGDHLQLFLKQNGTTMKAIAFGAGNWGDKLTAGSVIHIAVQPQMNEYNGCRSVELQVKDLQLANDE
ncbi:MAG TPA: DHHA1 domain-containing protein, partial [Tepidisphaeraceae bacterium]